MVDIETTGTDPCHTSIIQLSAVKFDYETSQIGDSFDMCLFPLPERFWDEDTRAFWNKNSEVLESILHRAQDPAAVIHAFVQWVRDGGNGQPMRLWAKPATFEQPFLASYFRRFGLDNPFHYRFTIDLNSFVRGMQGDPGAEPLEKKIPFQGNMHDALDDVLHQVKVALMARHMVGGGADATA
jgi:oligoribonuclease (3'-5' exoribonuclease)